MRATKQTVRQVAANLGVPEKQVSRIAAEVLGLGAKAQNLDYLLSPYEIGVLSRLLKPSELETVRDVGALAHDGSGLVFEEAVESALRFRPDVRADGASFRPRQMRNRLWLHPDVPDTLATSPALKKRLSVVLHHLAANGGTTVVKGCADQANKGWLRSPLGGNGGMQYYLWWAKQGSPPLRKMTAPPGAIVIRSIRHHDDHNPLEAGRLSDYLPEFDQMAIADEELVGRPWTSEQLQFVEAEDPIRLVVGRPGSGKTTVLWQAIESRRDQRVLYLTWSRALAQQAEQHLSTFASEGVGFAVRDFLTLVGDLRCLDVERLRVSESRERFERLAERFGRGGLGPWAGHQRALFDEVRAHLIGAAIPGSESYISQHGVGRLTNDAYLASRCSGPTSDRPAAETLLKLVDGIGGSEGLASVFPELVAAGSAVEKLVSDGLPSGYEGVDRIVVDEVQDLTLVELAVVCELVRAIARRQEYAPLLLLAGDEGQTVRPTGFRWGPLKDLVTRKVGVPAEYPLLENLRCPERISGVIERASQLYGSLPKGKRPSDQRRRQGSQHVDAHLFHVEAKTEGEASELIRELDEIEGVVVVSPREEPPPWLPDDLRDAVLTPSEAKGLEYQSVCVLDSGTVLAAMPTAESLISEVERHAQRCAIDQLRVALSRATESLAFVDVNASEEAVTRSRELLGDPALFDVEDLAEHFGEEDVSPEERILTRVRDARALIDERPRRAWRRIHQAVRLLGNPDLPNGVADESTRREAEDALVAIAARLLVDGLPDGVPRLEATDAASRVLEARTAELAAFRQLVRWVDNPAQESLSLLEKVTAVGADHAWLGQALAPKSQLLRDAIEQGSFDAATAHRYTDSVGSWLRVAGYVGDVDGEARRVRCNALDTLLDGGRLADADAVLAHVRPEPWQKTGELREAQRRHAEAAVAFEAAGLATDALRNWRAAGDWERALQHAAGQDQIDLGWLSELQALYARRPDGHESRMTDAERRRLANTTAPSVAKGPALRSPGGPAR